jgi:hypothetical protein
MGANPYSSDNRTTRSVQQGYTTKSREEIFARSMHDSMNPKDVKLRESRDSAIHPAAFPIILTMDVTGSMRNTPHYLVKEGLPLLITQIIDRGCPDVSLCFTANGDHISDRAPWQIGQFESGDEQLDMWLTRTYLEGNGGGNGGESYLLALVFAAFVVQTDQWDKRGKPGVLITIGDEPPHMSIDKNSAIGIFGQQAADWWEGQSITAETLVELASKRWIIHHIHVTHGESRNGPHPSWKKLLGERVHTSVKDDTVVEVILDNVFNDIAAITMLETHVPPVSEGLLDDHERLPELNLAMKDGWTRTAASGIWHRNPNYLATSEALVDAYSLTDKITDAELTKGEVIALVKHGQGSEPSPATPTASSSRVEIELM